jgi:hypothetical protein
VDEIEHCIEKYRHAGPDPVSIIRLDGDIDIVADGSVSRGDKAACAGLMDAGSGPICVP